MRRLLGSDFGSERTCARYFRAMRIFAYMGAAGYQVDGGEALQLAIRPNGSVNVSKFERLAEARLMMAIAGDKTEERQFERDWLIREFGL
jgi:hypothetical protein